MICDNHTGSRIFFHPGSGPRIRTRDPEPQHWNFQNIPSRNERFLFIRVMLLENGIRNDFIRQMQYMLPPYHDSADFRCNRRLGCLKKEEWLECRRYFFQQMFVPPVGYDVKAASFPAVLERDKGNRNNIFCIISLSRIVVCGTTSLSLFENCETTIHELPPVFQICGTDPDLDP
jgi:hypothetical protein